MVGGYIIIRDDVIRGAEEAISGGDVTFPYKGAFDYFKSLLYSNKPIMSTANTSSTGERVSPTYGLCTADENSINISFSPAYTLSAESGFPNRISVNTQ